MDTVRSYSYQLLPPTAPAPAADDVLEIFTREGARKMRPATLEVDDFEAGLVSGWLQQQHAGGKFPLLLQRVCGPGA